MQIPVTLTAGQRQRVQIAGRFAAILAISGATSVALALKRGTASVEEITTAQRGLQLMAAEPFDAVELLASATCTVQLVVTDGRVTVNQVEGATVSVTASSPLPVSNDRGAPGLPVYVSGLTYADAPAASLGDLAPITITASLTAVVAANVNRKGLRLTNMHASNPVAVGGPSLTWGRRVLVLYPGDTWVEDRAANVAWHAVCDAGQTATINVQEVLA